MAAGQQFTHDYDGANKDGHDGLDDSQVTGTHRGANLPWVRPRFIPQLGYHEHPAGTMRNAQTIATIDADAGT
jgi:hypothetical protein